MLWKFSHTCFSHNSFLNNWECSSTVSGTTSQFTAVSRKVVRRNVHATIPKGNMGYDQYTVRNDWTCRTYFCCFPLVLANICSWPPVAFFQISLKKRGLKTTHNAFRDCRVHFFRQPFSKWLYTWTGFRSTIFFVRGVPPGFAVDCS